MKYILLIFSVFVLFPLCVYADALQISVGQIQASGQTADDEFVEILNNSAYAVPIGTWSIQYKSASGTKYYKKNFTSNATIPAGGHYIVAGSGYIGAYDMKQSTFSLASGGGTVYVVGNQTTITDDADPDIIAQKTYSAEETPPTNSNQNTNSDVNLNTNANGNINTNTNTGSDTNSNLNSNANIPTNENTNTDPIVNNNTNDNVNTDPVQTSDNAKPVSVLPILINEFMPNPADTPEWVELYDAADYAVDLTGWHLADGTGRNIATLSGLIFPRGFIQIDLPVARLNNDGDLVIIRDAENRETDSVAYGDWDSGENNPPAPDENYSLARRVDGLDTNSDIDDFAVTTTPTPALPNIITLPDSQSQIENGTTTNAATATKVATKIDTKWLTDLFKTQNDELSNLLKADNVIIINNLYIGADAATGAKTIATATSSSTTKKTTIKTITAAKITAVKSANSVSGAVIFPPNVIAKDVFVVRQADRSVEVRLAPNSKLSPEVGDTVTAVGSWSVSKNLPMPKLLVKADSAMTLAAGTTPEKKKIEIADTENNLNQVVAVEGPITEKATGKLRIADADASILIKTNFEANKGDRLAAKGLLIKQGSDNILIPASTNDLSIIKPPNENRPPTLANKAAPIAIAVGPPLLLLGAVIVGKKFKKKGGDANA
jgi:Lamin Tail Domain